MLAEHRLPNRSPASRAVREREAQFYLENKCWDRYIYMYHVQHWPGILLSLQDQIPVDQYLQLTAEIWNSPQFDAFPCDFLVEAMMRADCETVRSNLMTAAEQKLFDELPQSLRLYRSHQRANKLNVSWALDLQSALNYMDLIDNEFVSTTSVPKEYCAALFARRPYQEVILFPRTLSKIVVEPYTL